MGTFTSNSSCSYQQSNDLLFIKKEAKARKIVTAGKVSVNPAMRKSLRAAAKDCYDWSEAEILENPNHLSNAFEALCILIDELEDVKEAIAAGNVREYKTELRDLRRKTFLIEALSQDVININKRFAHPVRRATSK